MKDDFDIIIVGAGTAGCVLANRLSQNDKVNVLLLEAGGWDWNPLIAIPVGARKIAQYKLYDWNDQSDPDPGLNDRPMAIPHGKVIGGGGSINYMAHTRGHPRDYDRWEEQGAAGWSYRDVLPIFQACENWERGRDAWRGDAGPVRVEEAQTGDPVYGAWFTSLRQQGFNVVQDYNGEHPEGFGLAQYAAGGGRRSSTAASYLRPALARPNLTVRTRAHATRVLFRGSRAVGVEYVRNGRLETAGCGERLVLCAGAINTPHLLMLSGIGPADHLKAFDIDPRVDLPVGKGLEDHLGIATMWERKTPSAFFQSLRLDRIAINMLRAYFLKEGPASRIPGVLLGFVKSKSELHQPDLELFLNLMPGNADVWFPGVIKPYQDGFGIRTQLVSQKSRGEVLLRSSDPRARPRVRYNSLSHSEDIVALREGFRISWNLGSSAALDPFRGRLMSPDRELASDGEIDSYIRATAMQLYHPACTCKIGRGDDAVVGPDLGVRGLEGLFVADASVMPHLVSANPNAAITMIAAKAAAMWEHG